MSAYIVLVDEVKNWKKTFPVILLRQSEVKSMKSLTQLFCLCAMLLFPPNLLAQVSESQLWQGLQQGKYIALLRHALAPGTGDPANFKLGDCSTQRNLSAQGREQAERIGQRFKENGLKQAAVYSSQWCRCLETAQHLGLGERQELPVLNSFFQDSARGPQQTAELRDWLQQQAVVTERPILLVTHQVNITGLTGVYPSSGELVVIEHPATLAADSGIMVVGTVATD